MSYSLVIGDKEYTLPSDIPIDKWVELNKNSNPFVWMNSVYDIPIDEIKLIPEKTRELAIQLIKAIMNPTWVPIRQTLVDTELINFEDIKLGQFIDLEVYIDDYYTNYPNIVKILYQTENNVGNLGISQVLNMDAVLEKPLIQSLNWLAWNKDKQRALNEQLRKR